jgi:hypothetical protein
MTWSTKFLWLLLQQSLVAQGACCSLYSSQLPLLQVVIINSFGDKKKYIVYLFYEVSY